MWLLDRDFLSAVYSRTDPAAGHAVARGDLTGWGRIAIPILVAAELLEGSIRYTEGAHQRSHEHLLKASRRFDATRRSLTLLAAVTFAGHQMLAHCQRGPFSAYAGFARRELD